MEIEVSDGAAEAGHAIAVSDRFEGPPTWRQRLASRRRSLISRWCLTTVRRPVAILCAVAAVFVASVLSEYAATGSAGLVFSAACDLDWMLPYDKFTERSIMLKLATDSVDAGLVRERAASTFHTVFMYDSRTLRRDACEAPHGILTARNLQAMCEAERVLLDSPRYAEFCVLSHASNASRCATPARSTVRLFYGDAMGTVNSSSGTQCAALDQTEIDAKWVSFSASPDSAIGALGKPSFYFDEAAFARGFACRARSMVPYGTPLAGYAETAQYGDAQFSAISKGVAEDVWRRLLREYGLKNSWLRPAELLEATAGAAGRKMAVVWFSDVAMEWIWTNTLAADTQVVFVSMLFVTLWISVHCGSALIGIVSLFQIIFSLQFAKFAYIFILRIPLFSGMNVLAIFILLGVGADDIFVYADAWAASAGFAKRRAGESSESHAHRRVVFAFERSVSAIFNTSFTTAAAFCATAISPIVTVSTFGIFSALCILACYVLVMVVTPALYVIVHLKCARGVTRKVDDDDGEGDAEATSDAGDGACPGACPDETPVAVQLSWSRRSSPRKSMSFFAKRVSFTAAAREDAVPTEDAPSTSRLIERYIRFITWSPWPGEGGNSLARVARKPVALFCVAALGCLGLTSAVLASRLTPPNEQEQWFPKRHVVTRAQALMRDGYGAQDMSFYPVVTVVFGMRSLHRPDFNPFVPCRQHGDVRYSPLDLSTREAQNRVLFACEAQEKWACGACEQGSLTRGNSTVCFMREFQQWHAYEFNETTYDLGKPEFETRLKRFRDETQPRAADDSYSSWADLIGFIDGELKFARLVSRLSMDFHAESSAKRRVIRRTNKLVQAVRHFRDPSDPEGLLDGAARDDIYQTSERWMWFKSHLALVAGFVSGLCIAFPIALLVLTVATNNIVLASFAIVTIGFVVTDVLALGYLNGDALGIKETIAGIIVIGLAVDYTIHLGHMFNHGKHYDLHDRGAKFKYAVRTMGNTVLAGAVTTGGSACFMYTCVMTFYGAMAQLMIATIGLSLVYSLFFLMPLLYIAGPQGDTGDVTVLLKSCSRTPIRVDHDKYKGQVASSSTTKA